MNNEGFGSNGSAFEYAVATEGKKQALTRLLLILAYVAWTVIIFTAGVLSRILLPLLCFIPLSLWILIFLTWRLSKHEIKLVFLAGKLTVVRQFDGKNPKALLELTIKEIESLKRYEASDEAALSGKRVITATRTEDRSGAYVAIVGNTALIFEANEKRTEEAINKAAEILDWLHKTDRITLSNYLDMRDLIF